MSKQFMTLARSAGKMNWVLMEFYKACMNDESAVLMTTKGKIYSPKALKERFKEVK